VAGKRGKLWKVGLGKRGDVRVRVEVRGGEVRGGEVRGGEVRVEVRGAEVRGGEVRGGEVRGAEVRGLERDFDRGLEREVGNLWEGRSLLGAGVTGEMAARSSRPATANGVSTLL